MKLPFKLPHKIEERNRVVGLMVGVSLAIVFSILYLAGPLKSFNDIDLDRQFNLRLAFMDKFPEKKSEILPINRDILFVEIEETTLEMENTFPDDPLYYVDIVDELGKNALNAKAVVFSKDYSRPFGRKVDLMMTETFSGFLGNVTGILGEASYMKQGLVDNLSNLGDYLESPGAPSMASGIASKLDEMIFDPEMADSQNTLSQIGSLADLYKDLNILSPDREKVVSAAMAKAGNVYFTHDAENMLDVPYNADDLRNKPSVRKVFEKMLSYPTRNRPENEKEGLVYDSYHNLLPDEMKTLVEEGANPFEGAYLEEIKIDLEARSALLEEFLFQNEQLGVDATPEIQKTYVNLRKIRPVEESIGAATVGQGIPKAEISGDGKLRSVAPAFVYNGKVYPHIDLLLAATYLGATPQQIEYQKRKIIIRPEGKEEVVIPLSSDGTIIIDWAGIWADTTTFKHTSLKHLYIAIWRSRYYKTYSAFQALSPEEQEAQMMEMTDDEYTEYQAMEQVVSEMTPQEAKLLLEDVDSYTGKIVLIGLTAVGTEDLNPVPLEPRYPVFGLHANMINMITNNNFIRQASPLIVVLIIFFLTVSLGFIGGFLRLKSSITTGILNFFIMLFVVVAYFAVANLLFIFARVTVPMIMPIGAIIMTFLLVFLYRFITEEQEKKKMQGMFSTYVNKEVVDSLIDNPDLLKLGGDWMNCSVFFSDVAGFTSISESMPPEDLVELLNEYLTAMTDIIFSYGGTLDKYIGDAIVAVYGAPIPYPDHAKRACLATLDQQKKLAEMRLVWKEQGRTELTARCGVNTGKMIAGNMGSKKRFCYTVMGPNVEFGEHLESGGKTWGTIMSISEQTKLDADEFIHTRLLDVDWHDGHPVKIYELMGKKEDGPLPDNMNKGIAIYEDGVALYFQRKWDEAIAKFNEVYEHIPGDEPSKKAIQRCEKNKGKNPDEEFDKLAAHLLNPAQH